MWDIIMQEHSHSLWCSTSMGFFIVTCSYKKNFSEKAITLKIRNPLSYPHLIRDNIYWLTHVSECWDMIEHFHIWVQKLYFL